MMKDEIILFETKDRSITLPVQVTADTVWLNEASWPIFWAEILKR